VTAGPASAIDAAGLVAAMIALLVGYGVGTIRLSWYVARSAGATSLTGQWRDPGPAGVWRVAGPGPGMLALTGDLAKGVVPVSIGIVTWSWGVGWAAGLGAVVGACWPSIGRRGHGPTDLSVGLGVLAGAALALAPPAALVSLLAGGVVLAVGRLLGRNAEVASLVAGFGIYPIVLLPLGPGPVRAALAVVLCIVPLTRLRATAGHSEGDERPSP
jgi:acyl phosphate:glycerol-3-phosphate acyltransferase